MIKAIRKLVEAFPEIFKAIPSALKALTIDRLGDALQLLACVWLTALLLWMAFR